MTLSTKPCLAALFLASTLLPAGAAGSIEVSYVKPEQFTDIGFPTWEREQTLKVLSEHFEILGRKLPDGQTLRVEVLDINLAGEVRQRGFNEVRTLLGRADWPQMTLRYALADGSGTLKAGEDQLADMNYFFSHLGVAQANQSLPYERRMLDRWFAAHFAAAPR